MTISSRTPEGLPSHCPLCRAAAAVDFSDPGGDAPCPNCGHLLWQSTVLVEGFRSRCSQVLGISPDQISVDTPLTQLGGDSLDVVELIMELEEQFDLDIPDEDAERIRTIGDIVRYLERRNRQS